MLRSSLASISRAPCTLQTNSYQVLVTRTCVCERTILKNIQHTKNSANVATYMARPRPLCTTKTRRFLARRCRDTDSHTCVPMLKHSQSYMRQHCMAVLVSLGHTGPRVLPLPVQDGVGQQIGRHHLAGTRSDPPQSSFLIGAEGCRGELHSARNDSCTWIVDAGLAR